MSNKAGKEEHLLFKDNFDRDLILVNIDVES
jgi:hypothetical protein